MPHSEHKQILPTKASVLCTGNAKAPTGPENINSFRYRPIALAKATRMITGIQNACVKRTLGVQEANKPEACRRICASTDDPCVWREVSRRIYGFCGRAASSRNTSSSFSESRSRENSGERQNLTNCRSLSKTSRTATASSGAIEGGMV